MSIEVLVCNNQTKVELSVAVMGMLEKAGSEAARLIVSNDLVGMEAPLGSLDCVEVAIVDDETSDRVHVDFMAIEGATDVITFDYGEIVIGVEVARRQALEYGEPEARELLRYLVHGLLHLAGHEDTEDSDRKVMELIQERLVAKLWEGIPG